MDSFDDLWFDNENAQSKTAFEQCSCEQECSRFLKGFSAYDPQAIASFRSGGLITVDNEIRLLKSKHAAYLRGFICDLPAGFVTLEASRPWIIYWILHALYLLGHEPVDLYSRIISTLKHIQNPSGGYGGGAGHLSQGAPNYAAVLSLVTISTEEALNSIDRPSMYNYFLSMKRPSGGFSIHEDGEVDSRSTYTVLAVARLLNLLTPQLIDGAVEYLLKCQTYEGGFGGEPGNEAHGGYTFCALAGLHILGGAARADLVALESWLLRRQSRLEGGFQGRTNKLVDSCYSFWAGAAAAIVKVARSGGDDLFDMRAHFSQPLPLPEDLPLDVDEVAGADEGDRLKPSSSCSGCLSFDQLALQRYILHCAQAVETGGMRDKPGKSRDFYHTCYSLSGLAVAQRSVVTEVRAAGSLALEDEQMVADEEGDYADAVDDRYTGPQVYGDAGNLLPPTSIVFNVGLPQLRRAVQHFGAMASDHLSLLQAYRHTAAAAADDV